ncbi:MAG TPA: alpha/beta family hydrolase [Acidimicrobiia bacterium]|nr:alpha/beta family hydrolase [Acidimicrobiia bacterium]
MTQLQFELQGRVRGADRAVLLAHGAGADMHAAALVAVADALADARIPSLRFDFPYRSAGRRAPDRPAVLEAAVREAAAELARRTRLPTARLVVGGRSMGGRYGSMVAADADEPLAVLGLLLLGYPLHPAGKPQQLRVDHFPRVRVPCLFVSGTRDNLAGRDELTAATRAIRGRVTCHWLESADHGFRPLKASGRSSAEILDEVARVTVEWVASLPD